MIIKIDQGEYQYTRPSLKTWLELEDIRSKMILAINKHDRSEIVKYIFLTINKALNVSIEELSLRPWQEISDAYLSIVEINDPRYEFPFLNSKVKTSKEAWDYEGRTWYLWAHLFAERYGWNLETIAGLDVDDAIALAQEITVEEQLKKEWEWSTNEIAYQAKGGFKQLERPDWMRYQKDELVKEYKVRKEFLPSGIIIRDKTSGNGRSS